MNLMKDETVSLKKRMYSSITCELKNIYNLHHFDIDL